MLIFTMLSFNSCTIEGKEVCGTWNVNGDYGKMQVEITPWKGKFLGYLLLYKNGDETIIGSKTEDFIFITDLTFKNGKYQDGKIYLDPNSETSCGLELELIDHNQLNVTYDCDGQVVKEIWYRKGYNAPQESVRKSSSTKTETEKKIVEKAEEEVKDKSETTTVSPTKMKKTAKPEIEGETKKQSSFYIVGRQEIVKYDDYKAMKKALETLWNKAYDDDFSTKLKNIVEPSNMYVSYSNYEKPKGKMTITLGYKVKSLSNIPADLKGVKIPSNDYLTYPMSGNESDFEGEGWKQLGELMMYRNPNSVDYEVYTFDESYNIKKAAMWIATK